MLYNLHWHIEWLQSVWHSANELQTVTCSVGFWSVYQNFEHFVICVPMFFLCTNFCFVYQNMMCVPPVFKSFGSVYQYYTCVPILKIGLCDVWIWNRKKNIKNKQDYFWRRYASCRFSLEDCVEQWVSSMMFLTIFLTIRLL